MTTAHVSGRDSIFGNAHESVPEASLSTFVRLQRDRHWPMVLLRLPLVDFEQAELQVVEGLARGPQVEAMVDGGVKGPVVSANRGS